MIELLKGVGGWHPADIKSGKALEDVDRVEVVPADHKASNKQQSALHVYCQELADQLNAAGYDMKRTLKPEVEIPWTKQSVKNHLWKVIQEAMTGKGSTTELDTVEPSKVHEVLNRHTAEKFGISIRWPSKEPPLVGD